MHIHKPRPLHGWREFLIEITIIVLGIVIALGGEQAVEWWHWRGVVAETRQALDRELAYDLGAVQNRSEEGPCIARRLTELSVIFRLHSKGQPLSLKGPLGQPQFPHVESSVWETVVASGAAVHMPLELRLSYSRFYAVLFWFRDKTDEESEAWSHLSQFDDRDVMTEEDWSALHQWKARAQSVAAKVDANLASFQRGGATVRPFFDEGAQLGVTPRRFHFLSGSLAARKMLCRPML
jgi:hypothetical protein